MIAQLQQTLRDYYATISYQACRARGQFPFNPLKSLLDQYAQEHPGLSACELKAAQYEIIAENFTPVVFPNDPFFFETGLKIAEYDGHTNLSSGGWLFLRNSHLIRETDPVAYDQYYQANALGLHLAYNIFDMDHHGFPYRNVIEHGLSGIFAQAQQRLQSECTPAQQQFLAAAQRGLLALKRIAERFAITARQAAASETQPHTKATYLQLANAAERVPWLPAGSFYEGLCVIWFLHEIACCMDGVGMSIVGSPDLLLFDLYQRDLQLGRETPESASELLKIWLLHTDVKLNFDRPLNEQFNAGEQGDTLTLGTRVNELTLMTLRAHRELRLIYPKIHCRINDTTTDEFLNAACSTFLNGENVLDFLNDDLLVKAQVQAGKAPEDAADYVAGGCWEMMLPECEHSEGANCYFDLARALDLTIQSTPDEEQRLGLAFTRPDAAQNFRQFCDIVLDNVKMALAQMFTIMRRLGQTWPQVTPAPLFSACLKGCLDSATDYSQGGAKYSPHGVPLTDAATFVNSLLAVRHLCFDTCTCTLPQLLDAVRHNWDGHEDLRQAALAAPHLGDGTGQAATLLADILNQLADFIATFKNERGGPFQPGLYSYAEIVHWAPHMNATPDGRRKGDFLAQGITPTRLHHDTITDVVRDLAQLPLQRFPANSVLTASIPKEGLTAQQLNAFIRTWAKLNASGLLQLNCLSAAELQDAIEHPQKHQNLIVRLYGYSAKFISLDKIKQQEFLSRQILKH